MINPMINPKNERNATMARTKNTTQATEVTDTEAESTENVLSAKDMAAELGLPAKDFRRWLRTLTSSRAGKGGRWVFDAEAADQVRHAWLTRSTKGTTPELEDADKV